MKATRILLISGVVLLLAVFAVGIYIVPKLQAGNPATARQSDASRVSLSDVPGRHLRHAGVCEAREVGRIWHNGRGAPSRSSSASTPMWERLPISICADGFCWRPATATVSPRWAHRWC